jgi:hypothetical protein
LTTTSLGAIELCEQRVIGALDLLFVSDRRGVPSRGFE